MKYAPTRLYVETPTTNQNIKIIAQFIKEYDHLFEINNAQMFIYLLFLYSLQVPNPFRKKGVPFKNQ